jgi:1,4-dihydroxy-2-naphthoate octaprenyltransferase
MTNMVSWFRAFRLRTLPLSFSSIILGSLLALWKGSFYVDILIGALVTTLFLQILSNLANDYGDFKNGLDNQNRVGPERSVQSGEISLRAMRNAIILFSILAFASGLWLLKAASKSIDFGTLIIFLSIGVLAILAALKYTMGKKPYGYRGMGDIAVFLFFGLAGVAGTYFLHTNELSWEEFLPAIAIGLLATGVLNLNNMRDEENDRNSGKRSLVVIMGQKKAKLYHAFLILGAIASAVTFTLLHFNSIYQFLFLLAVPMLLQNLIVVFRNEKPSELDSELKKLALATLIFAITMGIGLNY